MPAGTAASVRGGSLGHDVGLQRGIRGARFAFRQPQLAANDVRSLRDGDGLEEGDVAVAALAAEAAVARDDQLLRRDVLQGAADRVGDFLGAIDLSVRWLTTPMQIFFGSCA